MAAVGFDPSAYACLDHLIKAEKAAPVQPTCMAPLADVRPQAAEDGDPA
jgi:hypothetical protein